MHQRQWSAVDEYIGRLLLPSDSILEEALQRSAAAGLPPHHVSPSQGKLLYVLARAIEARAILEIGTLGGYSTIWLARALPRGGRLISLEADATHASVARTNIAHAGLGEVVEVRLGQALETLLKLSSEGRGPFDLIFIDADKSSYPDYLTWALDLSRPGSLIIADNVVRNGGVLDATSSDPSIQGARRFNERLAAEPQLTSTIIQTVGIKGYDGFAVALVTGAS